ncbi:MAG: hypothetical protein ALAOOOJD_00038 [bacterium]|nr:hypothetical protein [bacterium]
MAQFALGIDAAWTAHHPAGVALIKIPARGPSQLIRVARSYEEFCNFAHDKKIDWVTNVHGSLPNIPELLAVCKKLTGTLPNVVALDIPLGPQPITGRRAADRMVTKAYITRKAGTHSPTAQRPGPISRRLFEQLTESGFKWLPAIAAPLQNKNTPVCLEVYPHPAIIELLNLTERLQYKISKRQKYWPALTREARRVAVARNLNRLRLALAKRINGVTTWLPAAPALIKKKQLARLKGYEDALDAIVCAWIGGEFLAANCVAYGDSASAIWLPRPQ